MEPSDRQIVVEFSKSVRDNPSTQFFWSIQVVSAYESAINSDGDLDERAPKDVSFAEWYSTVGNSKGLLGYSYLKDGLGPSVVFSEEVRDIRDENPRDMQSELFDKMNNRIPNTYNPIIFVAAHEAMHRFYGWHKQGPQSDDGLMDGKNALASDDFRTSKRVDNFSVMPTPLQFQFLQSRLRPL